MYSHDDIYRNGLWCKRRLGCWFKERSIHLKWNLIDYFLFVVGFSWYKMYLIFKWKLNKLKNVLVSLFYLNFNSELTQMEFMLPFVFFALFLIVIMVIFLIYRKYSNGTGKELQNEENDLVSNPDDVESIQSYGSVSEIVKHLNCIIGYSIFHRWINKRRFRW